MKNFNLDLFKKNRTAETVLGRKVKYITTSRDRLVVLVYGKYGEVSQEFYQLNGKKYNGTTTVYDLVNC